MAFPVQCLPLQFVEPVRPRLQHCPPLVEVVGVVVGVADAVFVGMAQLLFDVVAVVAPPVHEGGKSMPPAVRGGVDAVALQCIERGGGAASGYFRQKESAW